jgi:hypothetical protein
MTEVSHVLSSWSSLMVVTDSWTSWDSVDGPPTMPNGKRTWAHLLSRCFVRASSTPISLAMCTLERGG